MSAYRLEGTAPIVAGERAPRPAGSAQEQPPLEAWRLPAGLYLARDLVDALDALLEATVRRTGLDAHREVLLAGLEASLDTSGREAVLPFRALGFDDPARAELADQARLIGRALTAWAREANADRRALAALGAEALDRLALRSHCEGYAWTPAVVELLMGASGGPLPMQLYNEYLHQFVLLRDALIPFVNWQRVPFMVMDHAELGGLRPLEPAREAFLAKLLTRRIPHAEIVRFAQGLFGAASEGEVYGFEAPLGYALPAVFNRPLAAAPRYLLEWHDARLEGASGFDPTAFVCEHEDYLAAPRSMLDRPAASARDPHRRARDAALIATQGVGPRRLALSFALGAQTVAVDAGQIARGHRFAYRVDGEADGTAPSADSVHAAAQVLALPGLVAAQSGVHAVKAGGDPLLALAILGKFLPGNVVVRHGGSWAAVAATGKGHSAKLVLDLE